MSDGGQSDPDVVPPPEGSAGRLILDTIADGIYVFDADWTLIYANAAALAANPFDREDLVGESLADLQAFMMPDPPSEADREAFQAAFESGQLVQERTTMEFEMPDGTRPFSLRTRRMTAEDGDFAGVVMSVRDVSERVAAETELRRQNERLDQFASMVSHDLRNPLNVASLSLDDLETDDPEALARAQRALERMDDIIEDVLALARADDSVGETTSVSLEQATREVWAEVDTAGVDLVVDADATLRADRGRLDRAIENLLRNAVQHGGDGVTVRVGTHPSGFYVADDGPGIPPDEREQVFDSGYSTADQGTGFGLDLVQQAVQAHDWTIAVTESADGGARFEISGIDLGDD